MSDNTHPYDFAEARAQANAAAMRTQQAEEFFKQMAREYAHAEERYRKGLAEKIVELRADRDEKGKPRPANLIPDLARGDARIAELKRERDIGEGMKDAALQALWRLAADRRDLGRFIDWSMRAAFAGEREPDHYEAPIGARRGY